MEIIFILYKPAVPGNTGAAARAIKTMGFKELRLIDPCDYLSDEARMMAHGSNDILEEARVFNSIEECIEDIDFVVGTTAKRRNIRAEYHSPEEMCRIIRSKENLLAKTGILFGTEESGLPNDLLLRCDIVSGIPLKNPYPSMNLGQAVMLYAWELSGIQSQEINMPAKESKSYSELKSRVRELLPEIGIPEGMPLFNRIMERFSQVDSEDINLLHSITSKLKANLSGKI
jgi:tRNA/rRNA methyltransferase